MCGIFGTVGFGNNFSKSLGKLVHRGPDDFGEYVDKENNVYLGHRRLSIIDLSTDGRQPMKINNDMIFITYNGEFYNYRYIKENYFNNSFFQSKTDTEVILHLYQKFGDRTPEFIRGMFAFCIYDKNNNKLFLCRDRCGIKPLYYYEKDGLFAFSSELNALKVLPNINLEVDPIGLDYYFSYGYIPSPFSAYKYIKKLNPAHYLIYDIVKRQVNIIKRYWNVYENKNKYINNSENEWIEKIDDKIKESTSLYLVSDVPLGVFLSGGLDSSMVLSKVAKVTASTVKTFTIGFDNKEFDERLYADIVSKIFKTDHKLEVVNPNAMEILQTIINSFGEPFSDASAIPTYFVSEIARKYVKVVLSGDGGDEVFAGYNHYQRMYKYVYLDGIPINIRKFISFLGKYLPNHIPGYGFIQRQSYNNLELYYEMLCCFSKEHKDKLYKNEFKKTLERKEIDLFQKIIDENRCSEKELITKLQIIDLHSYLPEDVLTKVDRMSMLHSLETRVPLLEHELIELVFSCPEKVRFKSKILKYIFKKILSKELPEVIIDRKKQGFGVPLSSWFRNELKNTAILLIDNLIDDPFLNYKYVNDIFSLHQKGGRDFSKYLYNVMIYNNWKNN